MGFGDKLRELYYFGEEKWYDFWDKVDAYLPAYKIIDPIDNIIPTFALFLVLIFVLLLFISITLIGGVGLQQESLVTIIVSDKYGVPISGAKVTVGGLDSDLITNDYGVTEKVSLNYGQHKFSASKGGDLVSETIFINEKEKSIDLQFKTATASFSQKAVLFRTPTGELASGELDLTFSCSNGVVEGMPSSQTIYSGTINISQPDSCGTLIINVSSPKYDSDSFTLTGNSGNFVLTEKIQTEKVRAVINLSYEGKPITDSITVQAYSSGQNFVPIDTETAVSGQAVFELLEGDYVFKTAAEKGYKVNSSNLVSLNKETGQKTVSIVLEKNFVGKINAVVREGSKVLEGVRVALLKKTSSGSLQEIWAYNSDQNGKVEFELTENGEFVLIATKEGYCDKSVDTNIGKEEIITIKKYDGSCGHELKVRVVDTDGKPVQFAKVFIFSQTDEDLQKLSYAERLTDFNGVAKWNPVRSSSSGEKYKVFGFKSTYSGWSEARELNATTSAEEFLVRLEIPEGIVRVIAKNLDEESLQFAEVQLFDEYNGASVSGKRIIEGVDGSIEFSLKADKMVYAVIKKEGYESITTIPKQMIGNGTIKFEANLSKPPVEEIAVRTIGFFKNGNRVQKIEANQEYEVLFELTAPKNYSEIGFFVRAGKDYTTKTEMDKIYIKEIYAGGIKNVLLGGTYNKPTGYSIDEGYLNLEENKWAQIKWSRGGFEKGKIVIGVKVKVRQTALQEERIELGYRAWGVSEGSYERDPFDGELGTSENSTGKQALYALTKPEYITVGVETICERTSADRDFCITSTYTDKDGFTYSFNDSFDATNSTPYNVSINIMNNSLIGFDNARMMIDNLEENILLKEYVIKTPRNETKKGELNNYKLDWIETSGFNRGLSIDIMDLAIQPQKTGVGSLLLRLREQNSLIFEKTFSINVFSDKKMGVTFLRDGEYEATPPKIISGKFQVLTLKARNLANDLEIPDAIIKVFDRFGTKIFTTKTNQLGVALIEIPASFPGEKLTIVIEKPEYETFTTTIEISKDVVSVEPTQLDFTVNPQNNKEDIRTVKIINNTGLDLTIKEIKLVGKLRGVLNESRMTTWFDQFIGKRIRSQDFEEIDFKVISNDYVPIATDLEGKFQLTLASEGKNWVEEVDATIRVGLGKDVDNPNCLIINPTNWEANTSGETIQLGATLTNNCTVDGKPVPLKNLGLVLSNQGSVAGDFLGIYSTAQVVITSAYSKVLKPVVVEGERIPILLKFTPLASSAGEANGKIIFEAQNNTDSAPQKITVEVNYNINYENMKDCLLVGTKLVSMNEGETASFAIINNCKYASDIQLDTGDLQAAISDKIFVLQGGESKEIQIAPQRGQIPGAYNLLINARQQGKEFQLLDNTRVIINPVNSCFTLTRYEYDVYDSPFNNFDGVDRGYIINSCVQKTVTANVEGIIPFDNWQSILTSALLGGLTGGLRSGKIFPDWISNLWADEGKNNAEKVAVAKAEAQKKLGEQAMESTKKYDAIQKNVGEKLNNNYLNRYDELNKKIDEKLIEIRSNSNANNVSNCEKLKESLKNIQKALPIKKQDKEKEIKNLDKKFKEVYSNITDNQKNSAQLINSRAKDLQAKISRGEMGEEQSYLATQGAFDELIQKNAKTETELNKLFEGIKKEKGEIESKISKEISETNKLVNELIEKNKNCFKVDEKKEEEIKNKDDECKQIYLGLPDTATKVKDFEFKFTQYSSDCKENYINFDQSDILDDTKGYCCIINKNVVEEESVSTKNVGLPVESESAEELTPKIQDKIGSIVVGKSPNWAVNTIEQKFVNYKGELGEKEGDRKSIYFHINQFSSEDKENNYRQYLLVLPSGEHFNFVKYAKGKDNYLNSSLEKDVLELSKLIMNASFKINGIGTTHYLVKYSLPLDVIKFLKGDGAYRDSVKDTKINYSKKSTLWLNRERLDENILGSDFCLIKDIEKRKENSLHKLFCGNDQEHYLVVGPSKVTLGYASNELEGDAIIKVHNESINTYRQIFDDLITIPGLDGYNYAITGNKTSNFLLFIPGLNSPHYDPYSQNVPSIQNLFGEGLFNTAISAGVGSFGGSALGGAALAALTSLLQAQDNEVKYTETFFVPRVVMTGFDFKNSNGIVVNSFNPDLKIYEYSKEAKGVVESPYEGSEVTSQATLNSSYAGSVLFDPQSLNTTIGLEELIELEFSNPVANNINKSRNEPFVGLLTVTGQETVYESKYDYDEVKKRATEDGQNLKVKREGLLGTVMSYLGGPNTKRELTAQMKADYLKVKETMPYKKDFHLLFDSYAYVDCGPNTYPCTVKELSNCDIGAGAGYTGEIGVPRMKLAWEWSDVGISECDSDSNPDGYNYCDSTQFSIMLLKRLMYLKEFFNSTNLNKCPGPEEFAGTKRQELATSDLDVGITSIEVKSTSGGALIKTTVQTNNNLELSAKLNYVIKRSGSEEPINNVCAEQNKSFVSSTEFTCELLKEDVGEGTFEVDVLMTPTLCEGCGNPVFGNDSIKTTVIIGASGVSQCLKYDTTKDYFEKVLSANNQLTSPRGQTALNYISFKANLLRDGFSNDFKADFDEFINGVANAPVEYNTGGFRELFLSDKFKVVWPGSPGAWREGKYEATVIVTFKEGSWRWENDNIESIEVRLIKQGNPENDYAIYKVAFNGIVGLTSDNGRQGYGAGYEQLTEDLFLVTKNKGTPVYARPNPSNNPATIVNVSTIKGAEAFNLLNSVGTRGNVLSISGDEVVNFVLTPSVAVPVILNVTRNTSTDAYAFYSAEVNGQPQNTGGNFISWTGIGGGCVDFEGSPMNSYFNTYDTLAGGSMIGHTGYGLKVWSLAQRKGTISFYGSFFAPQDGSTILKITGANESANFQSTMGDGSTIMINSTNANQLITTLSDVFELVREEKVCVIRGDYYWNNNGLREDLKSIIDEKESTCIPAQGN